MRRRTLSGGRGMAAQQPRATSRNSPATSAHLLRATPGTPLRGVCLPVAQQGSELSNRPDRGVEDFGGGRPLTRAYRRDTLVGFRHPGLVS